MISQPSVITANQKEAVISQGTEIPYQEAASSGAATIQFKPAKLELKVTPLITPDNRLILDISVKKDRVGQVVVTAGGVNVPAIDTSQLTTTVFIGDGQTVVLGGILETERRENEKKVPFLGDVPVLGHLFKSTGKVNNKDELLIFVTPKILRERRQRQLTPQPRQRTMNMRKTGILSAMLALATLVGCGGDDSFGGGAAGPGGPVTVGSLSLVTSSPTVPSDGSTPVQISAFVRGCQQQLHQGCAGGVLGLLGRPAHQSGYHRRQWPRHGDAERGR